MAVYIGVCIRGVAARWVGSIEVVDGGIAAVTAGKRGPSRAAREFVRAVILSAADKD